MQVPDSIPTTPLNSSIIEALSFLGPNGSVDRDSQACIFYDSRYAASICLGTVQSRANVLLGAHLQASPVTSPIKVTISMQHIYSHAQNPRNECAIYFEVNQSLNEALGGSIYFPSSLIELYPRCRPSVEAALGSNHSANAFWRT